MCRCLVKFILFFVNLIFLLIGVLVIAVGAILINQLNSLGQFADQLPTEVVQEWQTDLEFVPYVIIGLGCFIFLVAFSGCCGSITETKCLLITYASFMGLLAAAKIVITVLLFVKMNFLTTSVENAVNSMFMSEDSIQNVTFHAIEQQFKCCGTTGPEAYVNDYNLTSPTCCDANGNIPIDSLPIDNLPNLTTKNQQRDTLPIDISSLPANISIGDIDLGEYGNITMCKREESYQIGCTKLLSDAIKTVGRFFGIALIIVVVFELFAMFFSIFLIQTMKPSRPKYIEQPRYYY